MKKFRIILPMVAVTSAASLVLPLSSCSETTNHISIGLDGKAKSIEANGTANYVFILDKDTYNKNDFAISLNGEHIQDLTYQTFLTNNYLVLQVKCSEPYDSDAVYKFNINFKTNQWSQEVTDLTLSVVGAQQSELVDKINDEIKGLEIPTMSALISTLTSAGYPLETLSTTKPTYQWVWDSEKNVVFEMDSNGKAAVAPKGYKINKNNAYIWKMVKAPSSNVLLHASVESQAQIDTFNSDTIYSQYLRTGEQFPKELEFCSGLDAGNHEGLELTFVENKELTVPAVINTAKSSLTIESSPENITHYGDLTTLTITKMPANGVYTEHGSVAARTILNSGAIVAEEGSSLNNIVITSDDAIGIEVKAESNVGSVQATNNVQKEVSKFVETDEGATEPIIEEEKYDPEEPTRYAGGIGTKASPYAISTLQELKNCRDDVNTANGSIYFRLIADIDVLGQTWEPIGKTGNPYQGIFDGNGYSISNFIVEDTNEKFKGFFGVVEGTPNTSYTNKEHIWNKQTNEFNYSVIAESNYSTVIKNLTLKGVNVTNTTQKNTGGLVGLAHYALLSNCSVESGTINGYKAVGGICGSLEGSVAYKCQTGEQLTVNSCAYNMGGIVGTGLYTYNSIACGEAIVECDNRATIVCNSTSSGGYVGGIGGLIQANEAQAIYKCNNYGNISVSSTAASAASACGIAGMCNNTYVIAECINEGNITTSNNTEFATGISGWGSPIIYRCENKGSITGQSDKMAGIFASQQNTIENYATIIACTNVGTLTNNNPNGLTNNIAAGVPTLVLKDTTFENVHELNEAISSNKNSVIEVTLQNVTVNNTSDEPLYIKDKMQKVWSDKKICDEILIQNSTVSNSLILNLPGCEINVNDDCSNCWLEQHGADSTITIGQNGKLSNVIVTGSESKIINNGTVVNGIGIDGAATYGENNGTCSSLSLGSNASLGTVDKHFVNNGTIHLSNNTNGHTVDTCGGSVGNILIDNYGTIQRTKTGSIDSYVFCIYHTGSTIINCYENSKVITNTYSFAVSQEHTYDVYYKQGATYNNQNWSETSFGQYVRLHEMN